MNPAYLVPCRATVAKHLEHIYVETKVDLIELMTGTTPSFTTDLWTSAFTRSFLTLTAHYIKDWKLHTKLVATRPLTIKHTGSNIADMITRIKQEFKFERVGALVTDNAANMLVAARELGITHLSCYAHTLQLAIQDALKVPAIEKALAHARRLVGHFAHSSKSVQALLDAQKAANVTPLVLIQDVATRWNSQFLMIGRLLKLRIPVFAVLMNPECTKPSERATLDLPDTAWKVLEDIYPLLDPFAKATELLSVEESPTSSQICVILQQLIKPLSPSDGDGPTPRKLRSNLLSGLKQRFSLDGDGTPSNVECTVCLATFLDPRYKNLRGFSEEKKSRVHAYVSGLLSDEQDNQDMTPMSDRPIKEEKNSEVSPSLFDCLVGDIEVDLTTHSEDEEIHQYVTEPVRVGDPLLWWKSNANR